MQSLKLSQLLARSLSFMIFIAAPLSMMGQSEAKLGWAEISSPATFMKTLAAQRCPKNFSLSLSKTTIYCLKTKIALPKADVSAHCDTLDTGSIGFSWLKKKQKKGAVYNCPEGAKKTVKKGVIHCRFDKIFVPTDNKNLRPYCRYLKRGYIGYSYSL